MCSSTLTGQFPSPWYPIRGPYAEETFSAFPMSPKETKRTQTSSMGSLVSLGYSVLVPE